jgi:hypothetical protein
MAYHGWFRFGETEIINVARLREYATNLNLHWFDPQFEDSEFMAAMLGETYRTPVLDPAPWTDPDNPDSVDFYGVYPLKITGLEDSTRDAQVQESILDGGVVQRIRHSTKTMVFEVAVLAGSEGAAAYGFQWLKKALNGNGCAQPTLVCGGTTLEYFSAAPFYAPDQPSESPDNPNPVYARLDGGFWGLPYDSDGNLTDYSVDLPLIDGGTPSTVFTMNFDGGTPSTTGGVLAEPYPFPFGPEPVPPRPDFDPTGCLFEFQRHLRQVTVTNGPALTRKKELTTGDQVWIAQFTAVAGTPFEFGATKPIMLNWGDTNFSWGEGVEGGVADPTFETVTDGTCVAVVYTPMVDPECPALLAPPTVPIVDLGCFDPPDEWTRTQFTIPSGQVPYWGDVVPVITVAANSETVRNLRLRLYPDDGTHIVGDECIYDMDIIVSYVPEGYAMVFDAAARQIYVLDSDNNARRADSLVFGSDGSPFTWPVLSCGDGFIVTVDVPSEAGNFPIIDLSLVSRAA